MDSTPAYNELKKQHDNLKKEHEAFMKTVLEMRTEQTAYFKTRNSLTLEKAKKLEKKVDATIKQYGEDKKNGSKQQTFF
jgi:hypothetical protein